MKQYIITGASRGFGRYLAEALGGDEVTFHLVARGNMEQVSEVLRKKGSSVYLHHVDLAEAWNLSRLHHHIFQEVDPLRTESITLVNNAGMLEPVGPIGKYDSEAYRKSLEVNFVAPLTLTCLFVQKVQKWICPKQVVMISSGAANKIYFGWSNYCSAKAGLNRFTEALALEQKEFKYPVHAFAFNPGRTDTQMQQVVREQSAEDFPMVDSFIRSKREGTLADPVEVSAKLARLILSGEAPPGKMIDAADVE